MKKDPHSKPKKILFQKALWNALLLTPTVVLIGLWVSSGFGQSRLLIVGKDGFSGAGFFVEPGTFKIGYTGRLRNNHLYQIVAFFDSYDPSNSRVSGDPFSNPTHSDVFKGFFFLEGGHDHRFISLPFWLLTSVSIVAGGLPWLMARNRRKRQRG